MVFGVVGFVVGVDFVVVAWDVVVVFGVVGFVKLNFRKWV